MEYYVVDSGISRFTIRAFASGLLSAFGHNPTVSVGDVSGEARFVPETFADAYVAIRIKAHSLTVTDDISDKDRREMERAINEDVLETARYPEIVFESTNVAPTKTGDGQFKIDVTGNLTMHGVTNSQTVPMQVVFIGSSMRAHADFTARLSKHGIKPISAVGGTLKVKDELKCSFDIVARKNEGS